jgi:hypothetical protein
MRPWHGFVWAAVACTVGLTVACSGKTVGGNGDGDGGGGANASACDDYFQAAFAGSCPGTLSPPASELAHYQSRFDTLCTQDLALPGVSLTAESLEACVAAIKATGCAVLNDDQGGPCNFATGSLNAGASCSTDAQCASASCSAENILPDGGVMTCGTCAPLIPIGGACTDVNQACGPGATCAPSATGAETCAAITSGGAGASCAIETVQCAEGLVCNPSGVCAAPGAAGTACQEDQQCASPLVCPAITGTGTCQPPSAVGGPCSGGSGCQSGLACNFSTHQCVAVTWVQPGQPCNGGNLVCLSGSCPISGSSDTGTCPTIIPDGQPCDSTSIASICDTFANCTGGVCVLGTPSCP